MGVVCPRSCAPRHGSMALEWPQQYRVSFDQRGTTSRISSDNWRRSLHVLPGTTNCSTQTACSWRRAAIAAINGTRASQEEGPRPTTTFFSSTSRAMRFGSRGTAATSATVCARGYFNASFCMLQQLGSGHCFPVKHSMTPFAAADWIRVCVASSF